jgi:cell wall-associated NlpC family hydrolase
MDLMRRVALTLLASASMALASLVVTPAALANPPGPHDPFGKVTSVSAAAGGMTVKGWAADPDALATNLTIYAIQDGRTTVASILTAVANATVQTKYATGPTPGFVLTVPIAADLHTVCIAAGNVLSGLTTLLTCIATPLGTTLTSSQLAAHSPTGSFGSARATSTAIRVTGWATDPDYYARRATVVLYIDGAPARTVTTTTYPAPRPTGAGARSLVDFSVPAATGAHVACLWVVNIGFGSNRSLGCKAVDTRGPAGTGTLTTPTLNTAALGRAKLHIGDDYVWAAAGPDTFDCSGLVLYSYRYPYPYAKYGSLAIKDLPHQSELQFNRARLIPASRALPGDLVFSFDSVGDVYHVAIYVSPGKALAAIDEAHGVNYQTIWNPASVTYGSLTHT